MSDDPPEHDVDENGDPIIVEDAALSFPTIDGDGELTYRLQQSDNPVEWAEAFVRWLEHGYVEGRVVTVHSMVGWFARAMDPDAEWRQSSPRSAGPSFREKVGGWIIDHQDDDE